MAELTSQQMVEISVKALDSKRAEDIKVIGIRDLTVIADYFVIANGTSTTQTKALADEVEYKLKESGLMPLRIEGYQSANWIVLDYGSVVVHVFYKETRQFYNLERLWSDGEQIDITHLLKKD